MRKDRVKKEVVKIAETFAVILAIDEQVRTRLVETLGRIIV